MIPFKGVIRCTILGAFSLALAGCGDSNVVTVSGTLTYKGQPVTNAIVHFSPEHGRPSYGETDAQGRFTLTYDPQTKGVERGKHRVWVQRSTFAEQSAPGAIPGVPVAISAEQKEFFDKYSGENSTVEITIDQKTKDLKLEWD